MKKLSADKPQILLGEMKKYNVVGVILMGTPARFLTSIFTSNLEIRIKFGGCEVRSSCTSESQVTLTDRWVSQGTNSKEDTAREQHKPQEPGSKWERLWQVLGARIDEQEAFSTTQGHLCLCITAGMLSEPSVDPQCS